MSAQRIRSVRPACSCWPGAAIIGSNGLMVRMVAMPPTAVAFWRMLLAGVMLAALVSARHGWQRLPRKAWWWLAAPVVAFAVDLWMWHKSILLVGAGAIDPAGQCAGVLHGHRRGGAVRERLNARSSPACCWRSPPVAAAGRRLGHVAGAVPLGRVVLGLGAGVCYAAYNVGIKRSRPAPAACGCRWSRCCATPRSAARCAWG